MALEIIDFLNGLFCLIFNLIVFVVSLKIISKYFTSKDEESKMSYLLFGLTWIGLSLFWLPTTVSFLVYLITGEILPLEILFIIGPAFTPFFVLIFLKASTDIMGYKNKQRLILIVFAVLGVFIEIVFLTLLIIDVSLIVQLSGPVDVNYGFIVNIYAVFVLAIVTILGLMLSIKTLKSDDPEIKLRGKFLMIAFLGFAVGSILDMLSYISILILTTARIVLISGVISFYFSFNLPNWMKKAFLK